MFLLTCSDEVYANSMFVEGATFVSASQLVIGTDAAGTLGAETQTSPVATAGLAAGASAGSAAAPAAAAANLDGIVVEPATPGRDPERDIPAAATAAQTSLPPPAGKAAGGGGASDCACTTPAAAPTVSGDTANTTVGGSTDVQSTGPSAHPAEGTATSAPGAEDLVHVIWGLSKDFCASGLRVGVLWTRNKALGYAVGRMAYFNGVSGHTQWIVEQVRGGGEGRERREGKGREGGGGQGEGTGKEREGEEKGRD